MTKAKLYVEEKVEVHPEVWGTADAIIVADDWLVVVDYKHGAGVAVSPERNPQMMCYALGALARFPEAKRVRLVVVQPRAPGEAVKDWWTTREELLAWRDKDLVPAITRATLLVGKLKTGEHCRFCRALAICPAHRNMIAAEAQMDFGRVTPPAPESMTMEQLAHVIQLSSIITDWAGACKAYAQRCLEMGRDVPGWKLVQKRSVRRWTDDAEEKVPAILGDAAWERKLVSPATADKVAKKLKLTGELAGRLTACWEKPDNGFVLAPVEDKRPEVGCPEACEFEPLLS